MFIIISILLLTQHICAASDDSERKDGLELNKAQNFHIIEESKLGNELLKPEKEQSAILATALKECVESIIELEKKPKEDSLGRLNSAWEAIQSYVTKAHDALGAGEPAARSGKEPAPHEPASSEAEIITALALRKLAPYLESWIATTIQLQEGIKIQKEKRDFLTFCETIEFKYRDIRDEARNEIIRLFLKAWQQNTPEKEESGNEVAYPDITREIKDVWQHTQEAAYEMGFKAQLFKQCLKPDAPHQQENEDTGILITEINYRAHLIESSLRRIIYNTYAYSTITSKSHAETPKEQSIREKPGALISWEEECIKEIIGTNLEEDPLSRLSSAWKAIASYIIKARNAWGIEENEPLSPRYIALSTLHNLAPHLEPWIITTTQLKDCIKIQKEKEKNIDSFPAYKEVEDGYKKVEGAYKEIFEHLQTRQRKTSRKGMNEPQDESQSLTQEIENFWEHFWETAEHTPFTVGLLINTNAECVPGNPEKIIKNTRGLTTEINHHAPLIESLLRRIMYNAYAYSALRAEA